MAPGATITCTAAYVTTQVDVDNGSVNNQATATARAPDNSTLTSNPSTASVPITQAPALTLVKSVTPTTAHSAGDRVAYTFVVSNSGDTTITGIAIVDTFTAPAGPLPAISCPVTTLAPGQVTSCSASYLLTQADVDHGSVANSATATGTGPGGAPVTSNLDTATVTVPAAPSLSLTKSAAPTTVSAAGASVGYTFTVTNTGNVTVTTLAINDTFDAPAGPPLTPIDCGTTILAPSASTTCTGTYTVSQADVDSGQVRNTAHATALDPAGDPVASPDDTATVTIPGAPALALVKSATPASVSAVGDVVGYQFQVTNIGNDTVSQLAIDDTLSAPAGPALTLACPLTTLAPDASTTCTASYVVTQADLDNGGIDNTATAGAVDPHAIAVTSNESSAAVSASQTPVITLLKTATPTTVSQAGQSVSYQFLATNTGNITVSGLTIADTLTAPAGPALTIACPATTLLPGTATTCTATYLVTQADIDHGQIDNTAVADAVGAGGQPLTSAPSTAVVSVTATPSLSLVKTASPNTISAAGSTVAYSFVVTNSGNVTLAGISVSDTFSAPAGPAPAVTCPGGSLAPGATTTCTSSYPATQADIDHGGIDNSAFASGQDPTGTEVDSPPATAQVTAAATAALSLVKSSSTTQISHPGESVNYDFLVTNTGNVTLQSITITDTLAAPAGPALTPICPAAPLPPGGSTTCTADYVATQADIDNGLISNTATATGIDPGGAPATSAPSTAVIPAFAGPPAISLVKQATVIDANHNGVVDVGDQIAWAFLVTNTGSVTLGISVQDSLAGPISCPVATLAPAASTTCAADNAHLITQADFDAGSVTNTATATGTAPGGNPVVSPASTATVPLPENLALTLVKQAQVTDVNDDQVTDVGDSVVWSFVATNTGNVTLTDIAIHDAIAGPVTCPTRTAAPGHSVTCTSEPQTITPAQAAAGRIVNNATATGTSARGGTTVTSATASATVSVRTARVLAGDVSNLPFTGAQALGAAVTFGLGSVVLGILFLLASAYVRRRRDEA